MISDLYKFFFVHINAGGTSIEKVFDPLTDEKDVRLKHEPAIY